MKIVKSNSLNSKVKTKNAIIADKKITYLPVRLCGDLFQVITMKVVDIIILNVSIVKRRILFPKEWQRN